MAAKKKKWFQQGSFWTGLAAIVGGVGGAVTGQMDVATAAQTIVGGFAVIFVRRAIEEAKE